MLDEGLALYRDVGDRRGIARLLGNQAYLLVTVGDYPRSAALCRESLTLYREAGDAWALTRYLPVLAGANVRARASRASRAFSGGGGAAPAPRHAAAADCPTTDDRAVAAVEATLG